MKEERHLARCRTCREADAVLGPQLRGTVTPSMTQSEADRIWRAVRIQIAEQRRFGLTAMFEWIRGTGRRRPLLVWASVAAVLFLVLVPLHFARDGAVFSQAELNAATVIEHVDVATAVSVLVLETPKERMQMIWVLEPPSGDSE